MVTTGPLSGPAGSPEAADGAGQSSPRGVGQHAVTYKTVDGVVLRLHVWTPAGWEPGQHHPAVVFYHGGGWRHGSWTHFQSQAGYLASRGLVAFSVEYRMEGPITAIVDGVDAMNFVFDHASQFGVDRTKVVASGGSAGGPIALATVRDDLPHSDPANHPSAVILFNPATDTTGDYPAGWGRRQFSDDQQAELYSPHHHIIDGGPPAIIMHGTEDTTISVDNSAAFVRKMREAGNRATLITYDGAAHAFFNKGEDHNRYYYETLRETDRFLVALGYLSGPPPSLATLLETHP